MADRSLRRNTASSYVLSKRRLCMSASRLICVSETQLWGRGRTSIVEEVCTCMIAHRNLQHSENVRLSN